MLLKVELHMLCEQYGNCYCNQWIAKMIFCFGFPVRSYNWQFSMWIEDCWDLEKINLEVRI